MKRRKWTAEMIAEVAEFAKTHNRRETYDHFHISSQQIYGWQQQGLFPVTGRKHRTDKRSFHVERILAGKLKRDVIASVQKSGTITHQQLLILQLVELIESKQ